MCVGDRVARQRLGVRKLPVGAGLRLVQHPVERIGEEP